MASLLASESAVSVSAAPSALRSTAVTVKEVLGERGGITVDRNDHIGSAPVAARQADTVGLGPGSRSRRSRRGRRRRPSGSSRWWRRPLPSARVTFAWISVRILLICSAALRAVPTVAEARLSDSPSALQLDTSGGHRRGDRPARRIVLGSGNRLARGNLVLDRSGVLVHGLEGLEATIEPGVGRMLDISIFLAWRAGLRPRWFMDGPARCGSDDRLLSVAAFRSFPDPPWPAAVGNAIPL